jgi:hypothetical protein
MVTKKASGKPTSTKRRAAKSAGDASEAEFKRPPQEPIIIGGGSVYIEFDKKFKVKNHPNRPEKHKADHEDHKTVKLVKALIYDRNGVLTNTILLDAKGTVKVCYTGCICPA